jgi:hypothetical protein
MDDVIEVAERFAEHCADCVVCARPDASLCESGLEMMHDFHAALNDSLLHKFKRDIN